jgi:nucleolar protein 53
MAPTKSSKISSSALRTAAKKPNVSDLGAPSQLAQSTRKGKKAWRKNIDIQPVEEGLESLRSEERVIGCAISMLTCVLPFNHALLG